MSNKNSQYTSVNTPPVAQLQEWLMEGVCQATDGCIVEPDGICPHGCNSWLIELCLI